MRRSQARRLVSACLMLLSLAVAWQAWAYPAPPPVAPSGDTLPVVEVYDGDTIAVTLNGQKEKIRLIGVDTPETKDPRKPVQCFGREASEWTKHTLEKRTVRIETDPSQGERDKYGRMLAFVWRDDGLFVNQALIEEGYAHEYTYASVPYKYQEAFQMAEHDADVGERGLWSPSSCSGDTKKAA